ncbi:MAG: glycosyltransferase [Betaproteobacteria bacterium]|nr:MAG: glycosyltransferase [Betaproteobacteria bacterium]
MARVIFVTASFTHGGAERHSIAVMNRLAERGHECHAVYIKNVSTQLNRIRLRNGGTVRCLNAARYFDGHALADFAAKAYQRGGAVCDFRARFDFDPGLRRSSPRIRMP